MGTMGTAHGPVPRQPHMTPKQRLDRALQIRAALTALWTDDEADSYEVILDHLGDFINELSQAYEDTLDEL